MYRLQKDPGHFSSVVEDKYTSDDNQAAAGRRDAKPLRFPEGDAGKSWSLGSLFPLEPRHTMLPLSVVGEARLRKGKVA